jgi:hypothetical protein
MAPNGPPSALAAFLRASARAIFMNSRSFSVGSAKRDLRFDSDAPRRARLAAERKTKDAIPKLYIETTDVD